MLNSFLPKFLRRVSIELNWFSGFSVYSLKKPHKGAVTDPKFLFYLPCNPLSVNSNFTYPNPLLSAGCCPLVSIICALPLLSFPTP